MSKNAVWFPLSVDWFRSEMFDDATAGHRLAWVYLVGYIKANGRAGRAKVREKWFLKAHELSERNFREMCKSAREAGAIEIDGDDITLCNWRTYNSKTRQKDMPGNVQKGEMSESAPQNRTEQNSTTPNPSGGGGEFQPDLSEVRHDTIRALQRYGVRIAKKLAADFPGLTPTAVHIHAHHIDELSVSEKDVNSARLVAAIRGASRNGGCPPDEQITPKAVCGLAQAGIVWKACNSDVCEHTRVSGGIRWNVNELVLTNVLNADELKIPAAELTGESVVCYGD